jgi:nitrogen fixation/metabolism regulation signal transduction histidine kinase
MKGNLQCDHVEPYQHVAKQCCEREELVVIGATAALLAHEIANPLNGMYTSVQLLKRHLAKQQQPPDKLLASTAQDLTCEIPRLRSLLQDFRSLARPRKLDAQPTNLENLAAETLALEVARYKHSGIDVQAIKQILAKTAFLNLSFQIPVC